MDIDVVPPDVNRSDADFTVADGKILLRPVRDQGLRRPAADGDRRGPRSQAGRSATCSTSANASIRRSVSRATIETLIKAGAFDSLGGRALAAAWPCSTGPCKPAPRMHADRKQRAEGPVRRWTTTTSPRSRRRPACPTCPNGTTREQLASEKEVLGFYLSQPSAGRVRANADDLLLAHARSTSPRLPHRTEVMLGGMLAAIKFSHTKNPRPGSTNTKYAMFDLEDMARHRALHPLARGIRQLRPPGRGRRDPGRARRGRSPARQRRSEPDRQRADSAGRPRRPLHQGHRDPRQRRAARPSAGWKSCTKSCAAIPATASCNWWSAWPTAAGCT